MGWMGFKSHCLYEWVIQSTDLFKWFTQKWSKWLFMNGSLDSFKQVDSFNNETAQCVAQTHRGSTVAFELFFVGEIEQKQTIKLSKM